jgi:peptidoglycan/xylan/chitin deacetylase (PgdA/CDA1 family)
MTFDACATRLQANGFDRPLYDLLVKERLPATVFVSGRWIETHPTEFAELAANPLIEIGNHSYDHPHMPGLTEAAMSAEVTRTNDLIAVHGRRAVAFRPPFGDVDEEVVQVVARAGLPTVMWDVVSGDPSKRATKESIERQVLTHTRPGSIIIFHINGRAPHTAEALPEILTALRARGFSFALLSEFLVRSKR